MGYHLGLDPGIGGGYALVNDKGTVVVCDRFRTWKLVRSHLKEYLRHKEIISCSIEKVASKSGQGVKSVFTFGINYGGWLAILEWVDLSHDLIPPNRWQRMFLGSFPKGESKKRSIDFVNRRYPDLNLLPTQHGISDAICLALYSLVLHRRIAGKNK